MSHTLLKTKRCSSCLGRGHFDGIGMMGTRKCIPCNGVGHVAVNTDVIEEVAQKPSKKTQNKRKTIEADKHLDKDIDQPEAV
jgi:hypothetical protein